MASGNISADQLSTLGPGRIGLLPCLHSEVHCQAPMPPGATVVAVAISSCLDLHNAECLLSSNETSRCSLVLVQEFGRPAALPLSWELPCSAAIWGGRSSAPCGLEGTTQLPYDGGWSHPSPARVQQPPRPSSAAAPGGSGFAGSGAALSGGGGRGGARNDGGAVLEALDAFLAPGDGVGGNASGRRGASTWCGALNHGAAVGGGGGGGFVEQAGSGHSAHLATSSLPLGWQLQSSEWGRHQGGGGMPGFETLNPGLPPLPQLQLPDHVRACLLPCTLSHRDVRPAGQGNAYGSARMCTS